MTTIIRLRLTKAKQSGERTRKQPDNSIQARTLEQHKSALEGPCPADERWERGTRVDGRKCIEGQGRTTARGTGRRRTNGRVVCSMILKAIDRQSILPLLSRETGHLYCHAFYSSVKRGCLQTSVLKVPHKSCITPHRHRRKIQSIQRFVQVRKRLSPKKQWYICHYFVHFRCI